MSEREMPEPRGGLRPDWKHVADQQRARILTLKVEVERLREALEEARSTFQVEAIGVIQGVLDTLYNNSLMTTPAYEIQSERLRYVLRNAMGKEESDG